ncbi:MAG: response regulator [bacterium]|nr:response regulator [bacterium]
MDDTRPTDRSAETLRLALEVARLGFWDMDFRTNLVHRNSEWAIMLGYEPDEVPASLDVWREMIHPDDQAMVREIAVLHERNQRSEFSVEHRMRTKDGRWKWILNWGRIAERDEQGAPLRALGFHLDISARKRAEAELARADKLASLGTLAGGIAHDFNNILTAITGNITLSLHDEHLNQSTRDALGQAARAAQRAQELAGRLATFTRGVDSPLRPVAMADVLCEASSLALGGSRTALDIQCEEDIRPVRGDEGRLIQLVSNLLLNADQSMQDGGRISVSCRNVEIEPDDPRPLTPGPHVEVAVQDEGDGIPEELLGEVFDPFFTTKETGRGLGLSVVHSIARSHMGHVIVESMLHLGTTFRVTLPASQESADVPERSRDELLPGVGRILVVDDEEMVRDLAARVLERLGYEALTAATGAEAVAGFVDAQEANTPIDVVILDLTLPGDEDGVRILRRLQEIDPEIRAVVSSGYSSDPVMVNYREHGFVGYLPKPYCAEDMGKVLAALLERRDAGGA